jgi:hypothetical protein
MRAGPRARDLIAPLPAGGADPSHVWPRQRAALRGASTIVRALAAASWKPLSDYRDLLDFGIGAGRCPSRVRVSMRWPAIPSSTT